MICKQKKSFSSNKFIHLNCNQKEKQTENPGERVEEYCRVEQCDIRHHRQKINQICHKIAFKFFTEKIMTNNFKNGSFPFEHDSLE